VVMMVHSIGDVEHVFLPDEVWDEDARASPFPLPWSQSATRYEAYNQSKPMA